MSDPTDDPNVLLIVLDSVRARNCSLYGYERETTPFLRSFADRATVYTQARAPSNWSLPSHVSLFTGFETHEHRVTVHDRLRPGNTVFDALADNGYETGLFTENGFVAAHDVGLYEAFETVRTVPEAYDGRYDTTSSNPGPDGFYYADAFTSWLDDRDGPWAACVNLMDAHRPFEPRAEFDRWDDDQAREIQRSLPVRWEWAFHGGERSFEELDALESLYDGGIRQDDAIVQDIIGTLERRGLFSETLVVICGDHGDGFGERGLLPGEPRAVSHIVPMSESLLHVPLVVSAPGQTDPRRIDRPAALTAFPDVALGRVDRSDGFATDTVYATKQPVTGNLRERFERACDRVEPYTATSRAVYVADSEHPGSVEKWYRWGLTATACRIPEAGAVELGPAIDPGAVDAAFGPKAPDRTDGPVASTPEEIREPLEGQGVSGATREQLSALGYY